MKKILLNILPLLLIGGAMVYAAAPSGGYLPGATNDPDCAPGDTDCFVQLPVDSDDQTLTLSGSDLSIEDGNTVDLGSISGLGLDNLGDHMATQNLDLSTFQLVGNGGTAGISVANNGNVGIGTTSPENPLHISSFVNRQIVTIESALDTSKIVMKNDSADDLFISNNNTSGQDKLHIGWDSNDNNSLFTIQDNGNVGIGTTSPDSKLVVDSSPDTLQPYVSRFNGSNTDGSSLVIVENNSLVDPIDTGIRLLNGNTVGFSPYAQISYIETAGVSGLSLSADGAGVNGLSTDVFIDDASGNVGIGTTNPTAQLHVGPNTTSDVEIKIDDNGTTDLGNFHFSRNGEARWSMIHHFGSDDGSNANSALEFRSYDDDGVSLSANVLRLERNGNVGIGTISPGADLDVAGDIKVGDAGMACDAAAEGNIRYNGSVHQGCNGTTWNDLY